MSQGFNINSVSLSGALTRDPELRSTQGGMPIFSGRMAYNRRRKNGATGEWEDQPNYIDIVYFGGPAEWFAQNLSRGSSIVIEGELAWREYEARDGSGTRQTYEIVLSALVPVKGAGGGGGGARQRRDSAEEEWRGGGGFTPRSDVPVDDADFAPTAAPAGAPAEDDDIPFKCEFPEEWTELKATWRA